MHDHSIAELPSLRRQKILLLLERDGKVMASELSQHFAVSEDTIRRDLAELDSAGLVQRVHGGALPRPKDSGKDYFTRLDETDEVKVRLAQLAAQHIEDGQIVLFDSGSTTLQVARALPSDIRITAVTASPLTAIALSEYKGVKVILAGGELIRIRCQPVVRKRCDCWPESRRIWRLPGCVRSIPKWGSPRCISMKCRSNRRCSTVQRG